MSYIGRGIDSIDNISTLDNLSFNGSDATFNLTQNSVAFVPVSADALQIQIDGVIQANNFTISGSTVTFDFIPNSGSVCNSIKHFGVGLLSQPSDGSVTTAKLGADSVTNTKVASSVITGQTAITSLADTDKFLVSDASDSGNLKYVEKQYLGGGAMELIATASRTSGSASQVQLTDFMDSTKYISYIAHCSFKNAGNGNSQFFNFTSSGGATMEATNYYGAGNQVKNASGTVTNNTRAIATNENKISWVSNASTRTAFMEFVMQPIGVVTDSGVSSVFFRGQIDRWTGSAREPQYVTGAAYYINSTVPTGFVIGAVGSTWERYEIRVYGLKKA